MLGGMSGIVADVSPYGTVTGVRAGLSGINVIGLKRRGADKKQILGLRRAFEELFHGEGTLQECVPKVAKSYADNPLVQDVTSFISSDTSRHFLRPEE